MVDSIIMGSSKAIHLWNQNIPYHLAPKFPFLLDSSLRNWNEIITFMSCSRGLSNRQHPKRLNAEIWWKSIQQRIFGQHRFRIQQNGKERRINEMGKRFPIYYITFSFSGDIKSKLIGKYHPMFLPRLRQPHMNNKSAKAFAHSMLMTWQQKQHIVMFSPSSPPVLILHARPQHGWFAWKNNILIIWQIRTFSLYTFFSIFGLIRMNGLIFQIAILHISLLTFSVHFLFLAFLLLSEIYT